MMNKKHHSSGAENRKSKPKTFWAKIWYFLWEDNSIWSWLANILIAFLLIKFVVYPGLGLALGTQYPVVAVVSGSMQHDYKFDEWYDSQEYIYQQYNISKEDFSGFIFKNGFNKGDIIVLTGAPADKIKAGDVIVFRTSRPDPVIHRVVEIKYSASVGAVIDYASIPSMPSQPYFHTKGDHNLGSLEEELRITPERVVGKAAFRIPALGWIKIWFSELIGIKV